MMKSKISLSKLNGKSEIRWNTFKNDDEGFTFTVVAIIDEKVKLEFTRVPGRYMEEDGYVENKDELNSKLEKDPELQRKLIEKRVTSLFETLSEALFSIDFYGGNINGFLGSKKKGLK